MNQHIYLSDGYEEKFVKEAFDTKWIAPLGKNVDEFENEMVKYTSCGNTIQH